ncbi:uncharacterized protein LOC123294552 isoform X2 [Chrysoperla carnea]|uniref:uncharacterized protein LOC123294552 isoform X2 n=1 Tax=Chrysoperla carnea TaxID=189513 RepID=UPI001D076992|nr:uncharacterized protein LOC123294552 isoform X2 [Chrysoperla carnea]
MVVCSLHFNKNDYFLPNIHSQRRNLKKTAVPSCNLPRSFKATENVKNKRKFEKNNRKKIVKNTITSTNNSALKTVKNQVIEVDSERNKTASEQAETIFYKSGHMHFLVSETNFANTGIESCEILENDTKLSNHDAQYLFLIENEDIKMEPADTELTNENEQIKSDILDREFIIEQENLKCDEILHTEITIKEENIDIEPELSTKCTTAGENIKFDQEIHTEVIIKEEFFFPTV